MSAGAAGSTIGVASAAELADLLASRVHARVRLLGSGSQQDRLPPAPADAAQVSLGRLDRIERLEPEDLTCSVQPGLRREVLDEELAAVGLQLPCAGAGSVGGLFALDLVGPTSPGGPSPRTLLLGMSAVLADGTPFRSGARVVKSVAGFDVHKLLPGSRGTLFAATRLHLKLRPRPRAEVCFGRSGLDPEPALALYRELRRLPVPPVRLALLRGNGGQTAVAGRLAGRPGFVRQVLSRHGLEESPDADPDHLAAPAGSEVVAGALPQSRLPDLLALLPPSAPLLARAGNRFQAVLRPERSDALFAALPAIQGEGAVIWGAPGRLGLGTPPDPGAARLMARIRQALDPAGVLA